MFCDVLQAAGGKARGCISLLNARRYTVRFQHYTSAAYQKLQQAELEITPRSSNLDRDDDECAHISGPAIARSIVGGAQSLDTGELAVVTSIYYKPTAATSAVWRLLPLPDMYAISCLC